MQAVVLILGVVSFLTLGIAALTVDALPPSPECELDDDLTNEALERCRRRGERFLLKYLKVIRDEEPWDKCGYFAEFHECLQPLQERCGSLMHTQHGAWMTELNEVMSCACVQGNAGCKSDLHCFEREYGGALARRCDDYYKFNLKQRTMRKCHFIRERIQCKEALVTSACGDRIGRMAFLLFKHQSHDYLSKRPCQVSRDPTYSGFRYTQQCSAEVPARVAQCKAMFLGRTRLRFKAESDLVATGRHIRKKIHTACRDFHKYQDCVEPLQDRCPEVVDLIYNYDGRSLRTYMLKMDYICHKKRKEYSNHLECYQEVLDQQKQKQHCEHIWDVLKPMLRVETSYTFYCRPESNHSTHIHSVLHKLTRCYHEVFRDSCGEEGGDTMNGLMMRAFQDPVYLRFRFRPDCELHNDAPAHGDGNVELKPREVTLPAHVTLPTPRRNIGAVTRASQTARANSGSLTNFHLSVLVWTLLLTFSLGASSS